MRDLDDQTWSMLYHGLERCRAEQAHPLFTRGLEKLRITGDKIPDLAAVNERLMALTGWRGVFVKGLEDGPTFFRELARREFPIGHFIRDKEDLSYTPEPDIFHDLYGHLPFFADPDYADFCQRFGEAAMRYADAPNALRQFERVFWYGVEFPLIKTPSGNRIFGGGILSSCGESDYSLSDVPEVLPYDLDELRHREFRIDQMQTTIFLLDHEQQLYESVDKLVETINQEELSRENRTDSPRSLSL